MKDFEDLIGNENKINSEDNDLDDYADELQDQMTESLFNEADQMGIFQI